MLYTRTMAWINWTKVKSFPSCGLKGIILVSASASFSCTILDSDLLTYSHGLREYSKRDKEIDYRKDLEVYICDCRMAVAR
jgi:hypothetical protein